jgi:hypothetical protein
MIRLQSPTTANSQSPFRTARHAWCSAIREAKQPYGSSCLVLSDRTRTRGSSTRPGLRIQESCNWRAPESLERLRSTSLRQRNRHKIRWFCLDSLSRLRSQGISESLPATVFVEDRCALGLMFAHAGKGCVESTGVGIQEVALVSPHRPSVLQT